MTAAEAKRQRLASLRHRARMKKVIAIHVILERNAQQAMHSQCPNTKSTLLATGLGLVPTPGAMGTRDRRRGTRCVQTNMQTIQVFTPG